MEFRAKKAPRRDAGAPRERRKDYALRDVGGIFEAYPNGHKKFLTKRGLEKLNEGREDAEGVPGHPLNPVDGPFATELQRQHEARAAFLGASQPPPSYALAPPARWSTLVGQQGIVPASDMPAGRRGWRRRRGPEPGGVSVGEWAAHELGSTLADDRARVDVFKATRDAMRDAGMHSERPRGRVARPMAPQPVAPPAQEARGRADGDGEWDRSSTLVPEVPTLTGEDGGAGGEAIQTLRLRVTAPGGEIDLWRGDTLRLVMSGRGARNGEVVAYVVEDIVYGEMAYVNMLVDGGSALSGGGRSSSRTCAYVRVSKA